MHGAKRWIISYPYIFLLDLAIDKLHTPSTAAAAPVTEVI